MPRPSSSWQGLRAVAIALGNRSLATLLSVPLSRRVIHSRELLLSAAAVITSRYAGLAAGLLIAVASVLISSWFFDITPAVLDLGARSLVPAIVLGFLAALVAVLTPLTVAEVNAKTRIRTPVERQRRQIRGHLARQTKNCRLRRRTSRHFVGFCLSAPTVGRSKPMSAAGSDLKNTCVEIRKEISPTVFVHSA
jgi:hypothetical protein